MKKEDQLALMGFDELSSQEREELARLLNEEEGREVAAWAQLRGDLKELKEVPPCQLSAAHLREAILRDGIKPQRKPWWGAWIATAGLAAAACFGAAAILISGYFAPEPEKGASIVAVAPPAPPIQPEAAPAALPKAGRKPVVVAQAEPVKQPSESLDLRRLVASTLPDPPVAYVSRKASNEEAGELVTAAIESADPVREEASASLMAADAGSTPAASPRLESIVVISAPLAGAEPAPAAEVESTSHVVFGG